MNDLPVPAPPTDPSQQDQQGNQQQSTTSVSYGSKEGESFTIHSPEASLKAVGQEVDLPKEVQSAGVQIQSTTVALPQAVSDQGVTSVGYNVSSVPTHGSTITLPLSDSQIELALKKNTKQSIRWLAEWCVYQIKKMHEKIIPNKRHS